MNLGARITESMKYFDIDNEIQSCIDHVSSSMQEIAEIREWAIKKDEFILQREMNASWKSQYITLAILNSIKESNKNMEDEIEMLVKNEQEKSASDESLATESDNA